MRSFFFSFAIVQSDLYAPPFHPDYNYAVLLHDFNDVDAFLMLAATWHTIPLTELRVDSRADQIQSAA